MFLFVFFGLQMKCYVIFQSWRDQRRLANLSRVADIETVLS